MLFEDKMFIDNEIDLVFANAVNMVEESRFYTVAQHGREFLKTVGVLTAHC